VRESLFNMLAGGRFGDPFNQTRVLDLFAGTGALGLEAVSRGATHVTFVDDGRKALSLIRQNVALVGAAALTRILSCDAMRLPTGETPCDLVFLDPPYGKGLGLRALDTAHAQGWIAPGALIVWEENSTQLAPPGFVMLDSRRYGDTHVTFLRAAD
jgi:16S rRNA (guanine966-N2)-methyltransferase